jgi:hypothetical protein
MAHWKKAFPSRYLQVSDLEDGPIVALIKSVAAENVGGEDGDLKLVVKFHEPGLKSLVLNLTRAEAVAELAGSDDTEQWPDTRIQLVRGTTRYQGKKVGCIVVQAPTTTAKSRAVATADDVDEAPF